jgi:methylmalonyl-CoA mutase N-terminal domain/subunit
MKEGVEQILEEQQKWEKKHIKEKGIEVPPVSNSTGIPIKPLYTPLDMEEKSYLQDIGFPGQYPYTRGVYPTMYRTHPWTMRIYAGLGTTEETNQRFRYLLERGQNGLSVALDLPTQLGYDSDEEAVEDEVGRVGVAIDTLEDMETVFESISLGKVSTNFTINATAAPIFAMYLAVADKQGVPYKQVRGTLQNEMLKEYVARGAWIFPPEPSMRLSIDIIEYAANHVPRFNPISLTSAHLKEAGASSIQSIAWLFSIAIAYLEAIQKRGLDLDKFTSRLSFSLGITLMDFFEEISKYRAGRRIWARLMRDRFNAKNPETWMCRFFAGCGGSSLTPEEPLNNIVRVTLETLATVLGGAQAIHTCSYDEPYALPTEESVKIALRTQQIIAYETGVTATVDPLGGSYYVEWLTDRIEEEIDKEMAKIEKIGGIIQAIENGYLHGEIQKRAYEIERKTSSGELAVVGRNKFVSDKGKEQRSFEFYRMNPEMISKQKQKLRRIKERRDRGAVETSLQALENVAREGTNIMPAMIQAVKAYCTVGEITRRLKRVFGAYTEAKNI